MGKNSYPRRLPVLALTFTLLCSGTAAAETPASVLSPGQLQRIADGTSLFLAEGLHAPRKTDSNAIATQILTDWMHQYDPWAHAFTREEYHAFRNSMNSDYAGIQMDIQQLEDGTFICHPFLDGGAKQAGILEGDRLLAIENRPAARRNLHLVGMEIRGQEKTNVALTIQTGNEAPRRLIVPRTATHSSSVWLKYLGGRLTCQIHSFTKDTPSELQRLLDDFDPALPLILDLRGNPGGSLEGAILSASLFLNRGTEIVTIKKGRDNKQQSIRRISDVQDPFTFPLLIILQDRYTASAAEVFTAALVQNRKAVSLGETSAGKGETQKFVELPDGSALLVTYARLLPPAKQYYNGRGLTPTIQISIEKEDGEAPWLRKLNEILKRKTATTKTKNSG
jgi:carboxyl-terminal processing protease